MSTVMLEITVTLPIDDKIPLEMFEGFHNRLNQELTISNVGLCGQYDITSSGQFKFPCYLKKLHDGLNQLRKSCIGMEPRPKVVIMLSGQDNYPIGIFPDNDLPEYLEGI